MKKIKFFAYAGAIALLSTGFVACSSTETEVADNPNYNPETGEVLTSFVMNVNTTTSPVTRMTSANTQATTSDAFRGITNAHLLSFKRSTTNLDGGLITSALTSDKHYTLGNVYNTGQAKTDGSKSHRVLELALPTETNTLMFYGRAPKSATDNFSQGNIKYLEEVTNANATDLTNYNFEVKQIVETNASGYNQLYRNYGDLLMAALNFVLASKLNAYDVQYDADGNGTIETTEHYPTTLSWFDFVTVAADGTVAVASKSPIDGAPMFAMGEILGLTLANICTVNTGEVRAGSGPAVARMLGDISVIMNNIAISEATSLDDAKAKALASLINSRISSLTTGTAPSVTWKEYSDIVTATGYTGSTDGIGAVGTKTALMAFPMDKFNLPAGCAQIATTVAKTSTDTNGQVTEAGLVTFHHIKDVKMFDTAGSTSCYNVFYPAELCYWGNSPIRVTNEALVESDYPEGIADWLTEGSWTSKNWTGKSHVVSTTRSVAMQYNINYGTSMLKSIVKYGAATLQDNNHAIQLAKNPTLGASDEPNATITVNDNTFALKGILIGGMAAKVGYDFLPASGQTFGNAIYDKAIVSEEIPASGQSAANYTLVWDNWNATSQGNKQNNVYVCLEFQNNSGKDFWGEHNIIRNEGIFYIIGKLDPNAGFTFADPEHPTAEELAAGITWPTDGTASLPPYDTDGKTVKERRVFIQDFMTSATFVIGETSLQHAYSTVPDLRSTQISLGLSVDLKWQSGLTFDNVVLGNK